MEIDTDSRGNKYPAPSSNEVASPKPCVSYRGAVGINGTSHGLIANS